MPIRRPRNFGLDHGLRCPACAGIMDLVRRSPHPQHGNECELQNFVCHGCGKHLQRGIDRHGAPTDPPLANPARA
jgi:transposase-like protein